VKKTEQSNAAEAVIEHLFQPVVVLRESLPGDEA
jgi:hypothetical protein